MSKRLVNKFKFGRNFEIPDGVLQSVLTTLNTEGRERMKEDQANQVRTRQASPDQPEHLIFNDNPRAFNYGDDLMIRGSELLKYPQLYSHMGWFDTKDSNILPNQYYRIGKEGQLDPTHFVNFNNTDTYTPIQEQYLQQILNQAFARNSWYGQNRERSKQGEITETSNLDINPVLGGFVPGADNMYDLGNEEGFLDAMRGQTMGMRTAGFFSPPGVYAGGLLMAGNGYDRIRNGESFGDKALGTGEILLGLAPYLHKGYAGIRSAVDPKYALSKAIDEVPLNQEMLASYNEPLPKQHYYYSDYANHEGAFPFSYQADHLHGVDPVDIGIMLSREGIFDKNVKPGSFKFKTTLPSGKYIYKERVPVQPSNYPVQTAVNPELPTASWGYRGGRNNPDRVVKVEDASGMPKTNKVVVAGEVSPEGKVVVKTVFGATSKAPRTFGPIYTDLIGNRPSQNIIQELNQSRSFYDQNGIVDSEAIPARNPYNKGSKYSFIPYKSLKLNYPANSFTTEGLWASGKQEAINYLTSDVYKERLMTNLGFTEQEADFYIQQQLKNLDNVELINLGQYKVGRPFGHTIGYTVGGQSGPHIFERIQKTSDWLPTGWSENKYLEFIKPYEQHFNTYNKAKQGITQVGFSEGPAVKFAKTPFEEATHATSRGGTDPTLDIIFNKNSELVNNLRGTSPRMLNPVETRTAGMELDRAWEAAQPYINELYKGMSKSMQKERFFYDYLKASDDAGQAFYEFMQKNAPNWIKKYSVDHDLIINNFANGINPDEAAFEFWRDFVQNDTKSQDDINNQYNIT